MLSFQIVPQGFKEAEKILTAAGKNFPKAAKDAALRGLKHGRTQADKVIRARYAIKKEDVMPKLRVEFDAKGGSLEAKGSMIPVEKFKPTQVGKGVKITILRGGGRKLIKSAFIRKGRVLQREQPARYPVYVVWTSAVPLMASVEQVSELIQKDIEKATSKRLASNIERALAGKAFS